MGPFSSGLERAVSKVEVSRRQVAAFLLARHHLSQRAPRRHMVSACGDVASVQALVLGAARLSLRVRVERITAADVDRALWEDRTLVKTWAMRGTLHLVPAKDLLIVLRALHGNTRRDFKRWVRWTGSLPRRSRPSSPPLRRS